MGLSPGGPPGGRPVVGWLSPCFGRGVAVGVGGGGSPRVEGGRGGLLWLFGLGGSCDAGELGVASSVRGALGGFDRFSVILQGAFARFGGVVIQWLPDTEECLVVAALDADGAEVELPDPSLLQVWSESLPATVPTGVIRLLAPHVDVTAVGEFQVLRDVPVWRQVLHGAVELANSSRADDDVRGLLVDGAWLVLSSIGLPSGGVLVDEGGHPTGVSEAPTGAGRTMPWAEITGVVGEAVSVRLRAMCETLAHQTGHSTRVVSLDG